MRHENQHDLHNTRRSRGAVIAAVVVLLLAANIAIIGFALTVTSDQSIAVDRLDTVRAFYAAEAGVSMAVRELMLSEDEDGDGSIGSISDDGNPDNNPTLPQASVVVTVSTGGGSDVTLTSTGSAGQSRRSLEALLSSS
ncbi:MAG: hypothetical protein D8M59_01115 [Planctomycetes bacterium]|nr:hypothetical protein [Planctomycetota bacterium]NOG54679.1 hypothetical protein [Planctomycetota bacterium]